MNARATISRLVALLSLWLTIPLTAEDWRDDSSHHEGMAHVNGINVHYLDWGGKGDTVLLLAGLGNTAHIFDDFAPELTNQFRVLGLTRRGFGQSARPANGYDSTNLVKDIAGFLDALHLEKVILIGHSLAGQEMTRLAGEYPDRVRKMVYLDAAYDYSVGADVIVRFQSLLPRPSKNDQSTFAALLAWRQKHFPGWNRACENDFRATRLKSGGEHTAQDSASESVQQAIIKGLILSGAPDFDRVKAPSLAIFADHDTGRFLSRAEETKDDRAKNVIDAVITWQKNQKELFQRRVKVSRVVTLSSTDHFCFIHKQAEVLGEVRKFLAQP